MTLVLLYVGLKGLKVPPQSELVPLVEADCLSDCVITPTEEAGLPEDEVLTMTERRVRTQEEIEQLDNDQHG